jgi:hypothetical protein
MKPMYAFTPIPPAREASQKPAAVAALFGSWRGRFIDESGNEQSFTLLRDTSLDASVAGRFLFFATRDVSPTGVKLLEASQQAFVALIGPYYDPTENTHVVTVLEGVRKGEVLEGTFHTCLHEWRKIVRRGQFTATRAEPSHRAA